MKLFLFSSILLFISFGINAQVGIGTTLPDGALDVVSTTDGLLIPRVALTATNVATVLTPTVSELVYNSATSAVGPNQVTPGYYYWDGSLWIRLATGNSSNDWSLLGNAGISVASNFIGTTDDIDLPFRRNNLAAGKIGANSISFGVGALGTSTAANNTAIGASALSGNTTGTSNVALGLSAGSNLTSGSNNIMIGANTVAPVVGNSDQLNIGNTLFGTMAGALTSGVNTTRTIGFNVLSPQAALDITSSNNGLLIPRVALNNTTTVLPVITGRASEIVYNTASINDVTPGFYFLSTNTGPWVRFATGSITGWSTTGNTVGAATSFIGTLDGFDLAFKRAGSAAGFIGVTNNAIGVGALAANIGTNNTAFGTNALAANNSPGDNTAIGYNAMAANTQNLGSGNLNTAVGSGALDSLNGGARNTAVGANALTGVNGNASLDNVAVGHNALPGVGTITESVAVGAGALLNSGSATTRSTAIGFNAGNNISLSIDSVFIGRNALGSGATATNQIVIGSAASANADNTVTLGNGSIGSLRCAAVTITALSDRRDKANIVTLVEGIEFLKKLKPVSYTWNTRDKSKVGIKAAGFIAQDLLDLQQKSAIGENLDLVTYNNPERLEARYGNLLPVIVKGIQEQQDQIEALKKANLELTKANTAILERLEELEKKMINSSK